MHHIGQYMTHDDAQVPHPEGMRRLDVFKLRQLQRLTAQQSREPGPAGQAQDDAQHQKTGIGTLLGGRKKIRMRVQHHLHHQHRGRDQQNSRDRIERGVAVLDDIVDPAAKIPGCKPEKYAKGQRNNGGERSYHQTGANAFKREVEDVLPHLVGAKYMVVRRQCGHGEYRDDQRQEGREHGPPRNRRFAPPHLTPHVRDALLLMPRHQQHD